MEDNVIMCCMACRINFSARSRKRCPRCGGKLIPWDISKEPMERKSEWPMIKSKKSQEQKENYINYAQYFNKNDDNQWLISLNYSQLCCECSWKLDNYCILIAYCVSLIKWMKKGHSFVVKLSCLIKAYRGLIPLKK